MSTAVIIVLAVLVYIVQVLLMLAYPYYDYRQSYKEHKNRTVGGFVKHTNCVMGEGYIFLAFCPFIGLVAMILTLIIGLIVVSFTEIYNKYIKDIKI